MKDVFNVKTRHEESLFLLGFVDKTFGAKGARAVAGRGFDDQWMGALEQVDQFSATLLEKSRCARSRGRTRPSPKSNSRITV